MVLSDGKKSFGIYVHIPFCVSKCLYCDFCSFARGEDMMREYCEELCRRMERAARACLEYEADTVYFGGGTPTLLPIECFERIFSVLRASFSVRDGAEITCECNPATADKEYLSRLRALGVNRLSIGLQSSNENELRALGRAHSYAEFRRAFLDAREAGFDNISADLMYGIPEQTVESFSHTLDELISLSPEHISSYGLKIEDGTPFARLAHTLALPDEDAEFEMYELLTNRLREHGYAKYEISNFARAGRESRHNLRYWYGEEYLGFGVAAHSYFGGERFGNSRDIAAFLRGEDITAERACVDADARIEEYIMLRLRLSEGLSLSEYERLAGESIYARCPSLEKFVNNGFMSVRDGRLAFTDKGFFVSNYILSELL